MLKYKVVSRQRESTDLEANHSGRFILSIFSPDDSVRNGSEEMSDPNASSCWLFVTWCGLPGSGRNTSGRSNLLLVGGMLRCPVACNMCCIEVSTVTHIKYACLTQFVLHRFWVVILGTSLLKFIHVALEKKSLITVIGLATIQTFIVLINRASTAIWCYPASWMQYLSVFFVVFPAFFSF